MHLGQNSTSLTSPESPLFKQAFGFKRSLCVFDVICRDALPTGCYIRHLTSSKCSLLICSAQHSCFFQSSRPLLWCSSRGSLHLRRRQSVGHDFKTDGRHEACCRRHRQEPLSTSSLYKSLFSSSCEFQYPDPSESIIMLQVCNVPSSNAFITIIIPKQTPASNCY